MSKGGGAIQHLFMAAVSSNEQAASITGPTKPT